MTLLDYYLQISKNSKEWYCYNIRKNLELDINKVFENNNEALNFMKLYFFNNGNMYLIKSLDEKFNLRARHTVSTFLLGFILKNELHIRFDEFDFKNNNDNEFLYAWFIMALFHDVGYKFEVKEEERDKNLKELYDKCKNIDDFIKVKDIKHSILECVDDSEKQLIENYYLYRKNANDRIDHGIAGGIIYYNEFMLRYFKRINNKNEIKINKGHYLGEIYDNKDYNIMIAQKIIRHNMFYCNENNKSKYKEYGLDQLIPNIDNSRIKSNKDPLMFLLGICDTLEPIKKVDMKPLEILKRIELDFGNDIIILRFDLDDVKYYKYVKNILDAEEWLDVSILRNDKEIKIKIN